MFTMYAAKTHFIVVVMMSLNYVFTRKIGGIISILNIVILGYPSKLVVPVNRGLLL